MSDREQGFSTKAIHAGMGLDPVVRSRALPIHQTVAYGFESTDVAADIFALKAPGYLYSRIGNPTVSALEERIAALHGGVGAMATASGHAAEILAIMNLAAVGDSIVASNSLYGGTWNVFLHTFKRMGIDVRFADVGDVDAFAEATDDTTKAWFVETIGNPRLDVADIPALSEAGRALGVPLIVDNTFATAYLCRPIESGAAVVVESLTKWVGGHGSSMGGIVVDGGNFDWTNGRFDHLVGGDPSYHGLSYTETFGSAAFGVRLRTQLLRDMGPSLAPFNAHQIALGVETLPLRMERHCENAFAVASHLASHPGVAWVAYPGLPDHPTHDVAARVLDGGFGGAVVFGVRGGAAAGRALIDSVKLFSHVANVGDAKSLIIHPASTTHSQLSAEELVAAGIGEDFVRLSVGIEDIDDILADLDSALVAVAEAR